LLPEKRKAVLLEKIKEKAEEHGIEVSEINEYNTLTICQMQARS